MSSLIVEVCEVKEVRVHPNADSLEFAILKGWPVIVQKSLALKPGDKVVYFPPDTVMSEPLADHLGITKYLSPLPKEIDGTRRPGLRVRAARLRGEASYGTIDHAVDPSWKVGQDVAEFYGVTKYEPPAPSVAGDSLPSPAAFHAYTDIENIRNFPSVLKEGEEVVVTEKIHGSTCRLGLVRMNDSLGDDYVLMAGSSGYRRTAVDAKGRPSDYYSPMAAHVVAMLQHLGHNNRNIVLFGELYGSGVQDMAYGLQNGKKGFRAFDVSVDGKYLDATTKAKLFADFNVDAVPILYRGPFAWSVVESLTYGPTTMCDELAAGRFSGREGVVVTPAVERYDPEIGGSGRVILKSISADYLARKGATDNR
jgi:RNA ligase (TIGR02306 family)